MDQKKASDKNFPIHRSAKKKRYAIPQKRKLFLIFIISLFLFLQRDLFYIL